MEDCVIVESFEDGSAICASGMIVDAETQIVRDPIMLPDTAMSAHAPYDGIGVVLVLIAAILARK